MIVGCVGNPLSCLGYQITSPRSLVSIYNFLSQNIKVHLLESKTACNVMCLFETFIAMVFVASTNDFWTVLLQVWGFR